VNGTDLAILRGIHLFMISPAPYPRPRAPVMSHSGPPSTSCGMGRANLRRGSLIDTTLPPSRLQGRKVGLARAAIGYTASPGARLDFSPRLQICGAYHTTSSGCHNDSPQLANGETKAPHCPWPQPLLRFRAAVHPFASLGTAGVPRPIYSPVDKSSGGINPCLIQPFPLSRLLSSHPRH